MKTRWKKTANSRIEMPDYCERSVFEALVNALIHRDYLILGSEVHIDIYDDRLTITSPGGMADGTRIQERDIFNISSTRRNPVLADIFGRLGYMERQGSGFRKITEAYRDSILSIIGPGLSTDIVRAERLLLAGNPDEALSLLASHDEDGMTMPNRAYLNYTLFEAWQKKGDVEHEIYYLARTALVDIRMAAREYASLQRLARLMYEQGDLARAYRYMACSMEDAVACNARLRFLEVTEFYPIVERAYRDLEEKKHDLQYVISVSVSILAILFITLAVYLYISMKKLAQMRQNLSIANGQLMAANRTLEETGKIKEVYIARYLDRCVMYLEKLEQYRLSLDKLLRASKMDELVKLVRSDNFLQDERKAFYKEFDKSFLDLFPNFITDFNQLLTDEGKIYPKQNELLNTELRIFALIRLGVTDANSIAHFLGYSLATVYNYRSKIRGKARGDKDTFEQQVMNL